MLAIDGPAASGKGTLARRLAAHFGLPHLDTGLLYRATARVLLDAGQPLDDALAAAAAAGELDPARFDEERLRGAEMGEAASVVAAFPQVRQALAAMQRRFAGQPGGAVLDGRDIGTVIAPAADAKLFVTATSEVRAKRRFAQLVGEGSRVSFEHVLTDILDRDARDSGRETAPLKQADDAVLLDTSDLSVAEAIARAIRLVGKPQAC